MYHLCTGFFDDGQIFLGVIDLMGQNRFAIQKSDTGRVAAFRPARHAFTPCRKRLANHCVSAARGGQVGTAMSSIARRKRRAQSPLLNIPFRQPYNSLPPLEIISQDQILQLHESSMHILENIGLDFLDDETLEEENNYKMTENWSDS